MSVTTLACARLAVAREHGPQTYAQLSVARGHGAQKCDRLSLAREHGVAQRSVASARTPTISDNHRIMIENMNGTTHNLTQTSASNP